MSNVSAYVSGSYDAGLLTVSGRINDGVSIEQVDEEINRIIEQVLKQPISERELQKIKNQAEAVVIFSETEVLNRAMGLAYASFLGNTNLVNEELKMIQAVTSDDILAAGEAILKPTNCTTVYYLPEN